MGGNWKGVVVVVAVDMAMLMLMLMFFGAFKNQDLTMYTPE